MVVDTSCLMRSSGRLRRMVRRLGGLRFTNRTRAQSYEARFAGRRIRPPWVHRVPRTRSPAWTWCGNAVRLTGTAPVPNHFPPYAPGEVLQRLVPCACCPDGSATAAWWRPAPRWRQSRSADVSAWPLSGVAVAVAESEEAARSAAGELAKAIDSSGHPRAARRLFRLRLLRLRVVPAYADRPLRRAGFHARPAAPACGGSRACHCSLVRPAECAAVVRLHFGGRLQPEASMHHMLETTLIASALRLVGDGDGFRRIDGNRTPG